MRGVGGGLLLAANKEKESQNGRWEKGLGLKEGGRSVSGRGCAEGSGVEHVPSESSTSQ